MADTRLTVRLDRKLRQRLFRLARQQGKRASEVVRQAVDCYCRDQDHEPTCYDIALKAGLIGVAKNLPPDLSTNPKYMEGFGKS